jgi:Tfp pilus assembly PilM family ATPase
MLTGGGAELNGLDRLLHERTRLPVARFALPAAATAALRTSQAAPTAHLATVFGLGLIALDPAAALAE